MFRQSGNMEAKRKARLLAACGQAVERLEGRQMLAAHILGSSNSYATIQAAVDAAQAGATITVDAGTYPEMVSVYKTLTIDGAQAGVDARSNTRAAAVAAGQESIVKGATGSTGVSSSFYITANDVTIDGFTSENATSSNNAGGGIVLAPNIHGTHIINDIVRDNFTGLLLSNNSATDPVLIQHDYFLNNNGAGSNNSRGIYSDGGISGGQLINVVIDSNAFITNVFHTGAAKYEGAIALEGTTVGNQKNITITNNVFDGDGKLLLFNCQNVDIEHNLMTHTLDQWSGTFRFEGGCINVTVKYNTIYNNTGPGLTVDSKGYPADDSGFVVEYNNFYGNNTAYGNKYSLAVTAGAYDGTFDAKNNYWGSATGPSGQFTGSGDMAWGNGAYLGGANSGWGTGSGSELVVAPYSTTPIGNLDTPYYGIASNAGAPIQAEDFNNGGYGNGYSTTTPSNTGLVYRPAERIGIQATTDTGGGYNIGNVVANEWLDYSINVAQGGTYNLQIRLASAQTTGGKYQVNIDGVNVTGTLTVPNTGGAQTWQTVTVSGINITAGQHVMRLQMVAVGSSAYVAYFNWLQLVPVSVTAPPAAPTALTAQVAGATTVNLAWSETSTNQTGFIVQRSTDGVNFTQVGTTAAATTSFSDTTALAGTAYTYRVYATSTAGNSAYSAVATATTAGIATAPSGLSAVAISSTQVNLAWTDTAPSVETGFIIQRATGTSTTYAQVGTVAKGVTTYSDTTATAGTSYVYRVIATSPGGNSAASATASVTTPAGGSITTNLSSLNWVSATAGWNTVQKNLSIAGNAMTLNGVTYASGLGTHAVSNIVYNLAGGYTNFISDIGIDGEEKTKGGAVDFQVLGDNGAVLYDSGVLTNLSATVSINVNVTGVQTITLVATNGIAGDIDYDHADWAGAKLLSSASQPAVAPSNLSAVAISSTQVNLAWTNNSPAATAFIIQRATGTSTTFSQIGTTAAGVTTFSDTAASASTSYTYRVIATASAGNSSPSATASVTTPAANAVTTSLSSLNWVSATSGWNTVQKDLTVSGNPIALRGKTYATGIGTHAVSNVVYNLAGGYTNFISDVGVDDEENGKGIGSVDFQVIGDGKVLFDSGVLTNNSAIVSINVNITGVQTLTLVATNGVTDSIDYDHADWAGAKLISNGTGGATSNALVEGVRPASTISALNIVDMAAPTVPSNWQNISVGDTGQLGSASENGGTFTMSGSGTGVGGTADAVDYLYQSLNGNGTIVIHLDSAQAGSDQAGVLIREGTGAGAKEVGLMLTSKGAKFVSRSKTGGKAAVGNKASAILPQYEKFVRKGNTFTAYDSTDGKHWKKVGQASVKMNASVNVGLAVSSGSSDVLNSSLFSEVTVSN